MKRKNKLLVFISATLVTLATLALVFIAFVAIYIHFNIDFSADEALFDMAGKWNATVFYAPEDPDAEEYLPVEIDVGNGLLKLHSDLDGVCDYLKDGFIAVEDRNFFTHGGIDVRRTVAAVFNYIFGNDKRFGASTITQQVVKNISGDSEISIRRKFSEILRAINIESEYSKEDILELYLNIIPMGENMYGVAIASRAYFGKEPSELTAAEAATLIGITNAPTAYNPHLHPMECKNKRDRVLAVMHSEGVIDDGEYSDALSCELGVLPRGSGIEPYDSWFIETVTDDVSAELAKQYGISLPAARMKLLGGGYSVYTTEDVRVQGILEEYFENRDNFPKEISDGLEFAMAVTGLGGELRGVVGRVGKKEGNRLLNHATVNHTPGSVLKPLGLYAPLIEEDRINPATVFDDVPVSFTKTADGYREFPRNSPNVYSGLITVKDALKYSKNTVAVRLCELRGADKVFKTLRDGFGFDSLVEKRVVNGGTVTDIALSPMALGQLTDGVPLVRLTSAYTVFPSGGVLGKYRSYLRVDDHLGNTVLAADNSEKRVFSKDTANLMNALLSGVVEDGTASRITLGSLVDTAGKTGTSGANRDRLFVGYTPYYAAGIWCGCDDGTRSLPALAPGHLEIWDAVMQKIHENITVDRKFSTEGLVLESYCADSGKHPTDTCLFDPRGDRIETFYFRKSSLPIGSCDRHVSVAYDTVGKGVAMRYCPIENLTRVALIRASDREFPKEIYVSDAELVYRDIGGYDTVYHDPTRPYFYSTLPEGEYVGITNKKRQFNAACTAHGDASSAS